MPLALPGEILEANAQMEHEAVKDIAEAARWTEELKSIDPHLSVVWVPDTATNFDDPGRWHVRKEIPGDYDEWWPLLTDERDVAKGRASYVGAYKPPGGWLLDALKANDLWNPAVHRSRQEARDKHRRAKVRARQRETEQRRDEMALAHRAAMRLRGDAGFTKRTDLLLPPEIAAERKAEKKPA